MDAASLTQQEGQRVASIARLARESIQEQGRTIESQVAVIDEQVSSAAKLEPKMIAMREELAKQQRILSSTPDFVKSIFGSHQLEIFQLDKTLGNRFQVLPRQKAQGATVYILLKKTPIPQTLQLQYHVFSQPPNSYFNIHNLVVFSWGDPADRLRANQLSVSYFPDEGDKELIGVLSAKNGRVYADSEPFFRIGEPDPEFTGNKWIASK